MYQTFDAPSGEYCTARREASNTPLQALTLLNDSMFLEAYQALGDLIAAHGNADAERIDYACERTLCRRPTDAERETLTQLIASARQRDDKTVHAPNRNDATVDPNPPAATEWARVARVLFCLDEFITKN